ncbi:hypothetical protein M9H77_11840 [Catharanthus roseus]|uniref:Uncharacterized protein n=1 Tax=Catharanthus roseus TaxID=4058 RepID=A0ACC0BFN3_CATRO|nr:hypothetical protein M9H77_11840 [Catharanthus roseus]
MTHKTNEDLQTIISIVKRVRLILDRERLATILWIPDTGNSITIDSNRKTIDKDMDWNFDTACSRFEIWPRAMDLEDNNEADESYNPSDDEEDEADAENPIPMDAFQTEMRIAFEQLWINQEIQGMQLMEIVESTRHYIDELAHQRASIDRQEVLLARLCQRGILDQGNSGGGDTDFDPQYVVFLSFL